MSCSRLNTCPFYNSKIHMGSGLSAIFKKKYCTGAGDTCARLIVSEALGPDLVPANLYPGMTDVALQIIKAAGKSPPE